MATLTASKTMPDMGGWKTRHNNAVSTLATYPVNPPFEAALVKMVKGWEQYAVDHKAAYESAIGEDYVLGPEWLQIGKSLRGMLNGQTGRLDCGTVDTFILDTIHENGFTEKDTY